MRPTVLIGALVVIVLIAIGGLIAVKLKSTPTKEAADAAAPALTDNSAESAPETSAKPITQPALSANEKATPATPAIKSTPSAQPSVKDLIKALADSSQPLKE